MTSSNKVRRYLQHHKQNCMDTAHNCHQSAAELLMIDPTSAVTSMRKFRGRTQQQQQQDQQLSKTLSIPQICVDDDNIDKHDEDVNGHVAILDEFDEVLENELKRTSVIRTSSLKQKESNNDQTTISVNQQRSFSFALGSSMNLMGKVNNDDDTNYDESINASSLSSTKSSKLPGTIKASLSKETFSRLLHSLTFRSGSHTTSKITMTTTMDTSTQQQQQQQQTHSCLACQNHPNFDFTPKYRKRPSIFGVLVSKLNTTTTVTTSDNHSYRCHICKRRLSKSIIYNSASENRQPVQTFSSSSFNSAKLLSENGHILLHTKRRRSLPSLFHSLFDFDHYDKRRFENTQMQHRPSFSSILTHTVHDSITREQHQQQSISTLKQTSSVSYSSISLADSDDINENNQDKSVQQSQIADEDPFQLTEKLQVRIDSAKNDTDKLQCENEFNLDKESSPGDVNNEENMYSHEITNENNNNQLFLHPPEEKTRNLLVNVFRTRRSNVILGSNETNMVGKQLSVSVTNLATSLSSNRFVNNTQINNEQKVLNLLDQRKHALSEENLPTTDGTYIYFANVKGQNFKERLKCSNTADNTTLKEILLKIFEKHNLAIETCNICLRSAPTLPLPLDQPIKHILLDDLVVTGIASAGSHPPLVSPLRRLSLCRQLSDVLKYRRKSYCSNSSDHLSYIPSPSPTSTATTATNSASSTFTFVWNCALAEVDSPPGSSSNEDLHVLPVQHQQRTRKNGLSDDPNLINTKEITGSMVAACLLKQKSVSCDDVAFLSSSGDEQTICASGSSSTTSATIPYKSKENEKEHNLSSYSRLHNRVLSKTSAVKEANEKRNSIGSAVLAASSKSSSTTAKRLSTQCMVLDNDDVISANASNTTTNHESKLANSQQHSRSSKTSRSGLFTGGIFTRDVSDSSERPESNLAFVRRKCDEWLSNGIPKSPDLQKGQVQIDENDLKIEKEWQPFIHEQAKSLMSESIKLQQEAIYEMLSTEVSYIRQIFTMTDIFMTSVMILKSSQRDGLLNDIDMDKLFSNIQDVLNANIQFWKEVLLPIKLKLEQTGCAMNPSDLKTGFLRFDYYFKSYLHYVLDQKSSAEYFKQKLSKDDLFQYLIAWIEANFTNRLSFPDLTIKPLQRLTQYKLLLEAIQKRTQDNQQRNDLQEMIQKVANFVNRVNSKLHSQEQKERVRQINDRIGPLEYVSAPPELTSIIQEYYRDSSFHRLDLLRDMPLFVRGYHRQIIQQGPMKMKDAKNSQDVYCYLFTDLFLITKAGKRSGTGNSSSSTSSSLTSISNDGQFNRGTQTTLNKILKPPIRIDRMDVKEYDRRGGTSSSSNTEPNTASFVALILSEYNLFECGYLFQTNLSKQWIENIRSTKVHFQALMEESKRRLQNAYNHTTPSVTQISNSTSSIIHQSLPSLSSASEISLDSHGLKLDRTSIDSSSLDEPIENVSNESIRRSSKAESDVFKMSEQTRRNSRTDHKNYGRFFTADGTGTTHTTNPSSSSLTNPSLIKSTTSAAIKKRMSWNNEPINKTDSTTMTNTELSNTNSFRSVHSSSGVSSTGSFLFSADEESSLTTATPTTNLSATITSLPTTATSTSSTLPAMLPVTTTKPDELTDELDEFDGKSSSSTVVGTDDHEHLSNAKRINDNISSSNDLSTQDSNNKRSPLNIQTTRDSTPSVDISASSPESLLRRTPYPSVKKRNQAHVYQRSGAQQQSQQQLFRRPRIFDENDLRSSTHTVVYDSSKPTNPTRRTSGLSNDNTVTPVLLTGNGDESDYDNNSFHNDYSNINKYLLSSKQCLKMPVNSLNQSDELTHTDDLSLGDQNEIVLNNHSNINIINENNDDNDNDHTQMHSDVFDEDNDDDIDADENTIQSTIINRNQQSDNNVTFSSISPQSSSNQRNNNQILMKPATIDDSVPQNYAAYRKDPLTTRQLLDIRSHLLSNTTLDATEV